MKKYSIITAGLFFLALASCRLDTFMYRPAQIDAYELDDYFSDDESFFVLDSTYDIPENNIYLFTLNSGPAYDRETIHAVYLGDRARIAQDTVIVYCHGNSGNMDWYWQRAKLLANVGGKNRYGVLMMDYRGFGRSTGSSTEAGLYYDVDACVNWLKEQGLTGDRMVIYGFSLGAAAAVELTANPRSLQPSKIITEAAFASFDAIVQSSTNMSLPGSFFGNTDMDNGEKIKQVDEPLLWMHGDADAFMPIDNGKNIANNYQGSRLVRRPVAGGEHSTVPQTMGFEAYNQMIFQFMTGQ